MNILDHFSIPYKGMGNGVHQLDFIVTNAFFKKFEHSHVDNGNFKIHVEMDRRNDHSIMEFTIVGETRTGCDRCLEAISLPVSGTFDLHIKHGEVEDSTDEIMFIHPDTSILNLAQVVYEFILLSMPIIKVYDCEDEAKPPCNMDVLMKLENTETQEEKDDETWNSLRGMDFSE